MELLVKELQETRLRLIELGNLIDDNKVDTVPFEGSWTAGQLLEHVDKAVNPSILVGNTQATDRPADEKVGTVKKIFLDFNVKFESPDFILPVEEVHDRKALIHSLSTKFDELIHAASTMNLAEECMDFEVPQMGKFTRLEWISFYMIHTQRHLHQLENIIDALKK